MYDDTLIGFFFIFLFGTQRFIWAEISRVLGNPFTLVQNPKVETALLSLQWAYGYGRQAPPTETAKKKKLNQNCVQRLYVRASSTPLGVLTTLQVGIYPFTRVHTCECYVGFANSYRYELCIIYIISHEVKCVGKRQAPLTMQQTIFPRGRWHQAQPSWITPYEPLQAGSALAACFS